jgi:uncharacterized protein (DUF2267 family)
MSHASEQFMTTVQQGASIPRDEAERATRATLQTLGERIARGEAGDLAGQLPPEVAPWVATDGDAEGFDVDEFLRRVADREGVDVPAAEPHARAVFDALGRLISDQELADLMAELPKDYTPLLPEGPYVDVVSFDTFLQRVADRAATDQAVARRATRSVLETLAERIAGGEVDDLVTRLPTELHEPLQQGKARSGGKATRMSLDEFVHRVAEREGVSLEEARDHARAVFLTLREAVGDKEFFDIAVQLPDEYLTALAR